MRSISDLNNVDGPDYDYPYGRVRDVSAPGAGDGTPVNEKMMGDFLQFINKMMDGADITPNGLPDNDYSGFQIYQAFRKLARPYKVYTVLMSQTGTNAPTTTILGQNDIGNIVWTRFAMGLYRGTLAGAFDASKTFVFGGNGINSTVIGESSIRRLDDNTIEVATEDAGTPVDGFLDNSPFEIRVYEDVSTF